MLTLRGEAFLITSQPKNSFPCTQNKKVFHEILIIVVDFSFSFLLVDIRSGVKNETVHGLINETPNSVRLWRVDWIRQHVSRLKKVLINIILKAIETCAELYNGIKRKCLYTSMNAKTLGFQHLPEKFPKSKFKFVYLGASAQPFHASLESHVVA